jgi:CheY-like chemotaxis protein
MIVVYRSWKSKKHMKFTVTRERTRTDAAMTPEEQHTRSLVEDNVRVLRGQWQAFVASGRSEMSAMFFVDPETGKIILRPGTKAVSVSTKWQKRSGTGRVEVKLQDPLLTALMDDKVKQIVRLSVLQANRFDAAMTVEDAVSALQGQGKKILVVDDSTQLRQLVAERLAIETGSVVLQAENGREALKVIEKEQDNVVVLTDLQMPAMTGAQLIEEMKKTYPNVPVIMWTGDEDRPIFQDWLKVPVLTKKSSLEDVIINLAQTMIQKNTDKAMSPGGIDMNAGNMSMNESGEQAKIEFDRTMIEQFKSGDFTGLTPVILNLTPIMNIKPLLGLTSDPLVGESASTAGSVEAVRREPEV